MNKSIRIFIADDNCLLREGLASMLAEIDDITVVGLASSGSQALDQIKQLLPEVALVDIGMPDKDGLDVTQELHKDLPTVKVIILGMPDLTDEIMACIEAGAGGYVLKEASFEYLVESIRSVHRGESFCSPRIAASLFSRIAEIAGKLFIEEQTVKNHVHNILDKLQLHNRLEAVQYARERKLLKNK